MNCKPGDCGWRYEKCTIVENKWFDICLLKIGHLGSINAHTDSGRQLRINIDLPTKHTGGEFKCRRAFINRWGISIYRADKHQHEFKIVSSGKKYTISIGFHY